MAMTMHIDVVSAEAQIYSGVAESIIVPGELGELGILPRHAPLLSLIRPGVIRIKAANSTHEETVIYISGGIVDVDSYSVTVLADTAIRGADVDEAKALELKKRCEQTLANHNQQIDHATAQAELAEALAQLATIEQIRKKSKQP